MKTFHNFFGLLGQYSIPIIIILIEIIIALVLVSRFVFLRYKKSYREMSDIGERAYMDMMEEGFNGAYIVVRRVDKQVMYITDNIQDYIKAPKAQIISDFDEGRMNLGWRSFWDDYNHWDGTSPLTFEYSEIKDEEKRWNRISVNREKNNVFELYSFENITEEVARKSDIENRLAMIEEESQSKTAFLSSMSHEIRTPMNGIIGMTSLALAQLPKDHPAVTYLNKSAEVSDYLLTLINDILDMSRIESGKVELEENVIDIYEIGSNLSNMFQKNVEAKGLRFDVDYQELTVRYIIGDELRISQILINFLSNAVKFTAEGEITITFRQMFIEDGKINLMMRVHDTGKGMDPGFVTRIFHPFEQENAGIQKKYGGTGLGMAITDQMIQLMGGEIVIDTYPGKGSDFTVFLDLPIANEKPESKSGVSKANDEDIDYTYDGKVILLAEDNMINKEIAVSILKSKGATVDAVEDGKEAVEKFSSMPEGHYDFILMDIQMPVMDGRTATKVIRELDRNDAKDILIFALSADAFIEDIRASMSAGMNGHFNKPIDFEKLRIGIGKVVREKGN